jgi:copper resistance protein B
VHDTAINSFFLADKLEWQDADDGSTLAWDLSGWIGGDIDRLWLRSEGERSNGTRPKTPKSRLFGATRSALGGTWSAAFARTSNPAPRKPGPRSACKAWRCTTSKPRPRRSSAKAVRAARLEGDYDILLTNRLILQPTAELNFYGKNDPQRGIGSGLSNSEAGLRLRYEIRREFAPYIGVTWNRTYGKTADYARRRRGSQRSAPRPRRAVCGSEPVYPTIKNQPQ